MSKFVAFSGKIFFINFIGRYFNLYSFNDFKPNGAAGWSSCTTSTYKSSSVFYENTETSCDSLDNDCDGEADEGCTISATGEPGETPKLVGSPCDAGEYVTCGTNEGICETGLQVCYNGEWSVCLDSVGSSTEVCDGLDNDCDGQIDENCADACSNGILDQGEAGIDCGGNCPFVCVESPLPDISTTIVFVLIVVALLIVILMGIHRSSSKQQNPLFERKI